MTKKLTTFLIGLSLIGTAGELRAQSPYSIDMQRGWVVLTNESGKDIEAFSIVEECGSEGQRIVEDSLDSLHSTQSHHPLGESVHDGRIQARDRAPTRLRLVPQSDGCVRQVRVDAILYTDGSYFGDDTSIRSLHARREGLRDAVRYWRARAQTDDAPAWAHAKEDAQIQQAEELRAELNSRARGEGVVSAYWQGRDLVRHDGNFLAWISGDASQRDHFRGWLALWEQDVDADEAFQRMAKTFPRLPGLPAETPR